MFFQAVSTSTFLSLLIVLGNATPSEHGSPVVAVLCRIPVAKGEGSPEEMSSSHNCLVRQGSLSDDGNGSSGNDCSAADDGIEEDEICEVLGLKGLATR